MLSIPRRIVLASRSPRRIELLKQIGLEFKVVPSNIDELPAADLSALDATKTAAARKVREVSHRVRDALLIGADTLVALGDDVFGKPNDPEAAVSMLQRLSGRTHEVTTSFCVLDSKTGAEVMESEVTRVSFRKLSDEEIHGYVDSEKPSDYAGAYAIQKVGSVFVRRIEGCYFNVVGFPLARFYISMTDPEVRRMLRIDAQPK